jgi:hypothetical protein
MDRRRLPGIVAQHADGAQPAAAGAADRRAHVEGVERRQLIEMPLHQIGEFQQQILPLERLELRPGTVEGAARRLHRAVDILGIAFGDPGQHLAGRGVDRPEAFARGGFQPFAVD